jgi:hypothetical protein
MISGKGILYTVLAASSAAVLVGTMLTGGKKGSFFRSIKDRAQQYLGMRRNDRTNQGSKPGELGQTMGHS